VLNVQAEEIYALLSENANHTPGIFPSFICAEKRLLVCAPLEVF